VVLTFDLIFFFIAFLAQWRITRLWLARADDLPPRSRTAVRWGIRLFNVLLVAGCVFTFSDLMSRIGLWGSGFALAGAAALLYCLTAISGLIIYEISRWFAGRLGADTDSERRRLIRTGAAALMAAPFAAMGYGMFVERFDLRVRELDVPLGGLPPDLDGLQILQLSDIHLSPFLSESEFARVVDAACEFHPNLTVVTGDLISGHGDPLDACIRQLARLKADAGVFGCMGNHERYAGAEGYAAAAARKVGIDFLRGHNRQLRFGSSIVNLAGVDYQSLAGHKAYLRGAERMVVPGAVNILLSHNPDVFPVAVRQGYNFVIAGHTHGGQVTVEILDRSINAARFFTPYVYGLYREGGAVAYVTRGIGTIGIPARIGAPPEITLLRLKKA
jgi:predicted MPP superfamily phosphohydrolase